MSGTEVKKPFVIIGTSGSHDYLKDTSDRRYWPVNVPATIVDQSVEDSRQILETTSGKWIVETNERLSEAELNVLRRALAAPVVLRTVPAGECDGLHDEDAPTIYLCTRCFPIDLDDQDPEPHDTE
jgi:Virulence-associated protein E